MLLEEFKKLKLGDHFWFDDGEGDPIKHTLLGIKLDSDGEYWFSSDVSVGNYVHFNHVIARDLTITPPKILKKFW